MITAQTQTTHSLHSWCICYKSNKSLTSEFVATIYHLRSSLHTAFVLDNDLSHTHNERNFKEKAALI